MEQGIEQARAGAVRLADDHHRRGLKFGNGIVIDAEQTRIFARELEAAAGKLPEAQMHAFADQYMTQVAALSGIDPAPASVEDEAEALARIYQDEYRLAKRRPTARRKWLWRVVVPVLLASLVIRTVLLS
ncbi:hypothetical protein SAMN05428989_3729 [Pseudoxanthomonas sp. GM95]|uniref:hypothetical protein n=1 Tax=Pseudoxanthomonas sp. GM95 TaxID=1881043 RepID=UPI0008ABF2D3|nr:hypothetical protein [Pseudoxanthomonas sp. GM95]SEM39477.1 hypothetical protein SAMN05428989_3729 [Pseudoxanthomonas sp. GM95]